MLKAVEIHQQVSRPEGRSLADCGGLSRLEMRISEGRHILIFLRKIRKSGYCVDELFLYPQQPLTHLNHIGIVADIAACGAEVDYRLRIGAAFAVGVDMSHHVVAQLMLVFGCLGIIYIIDMLFHLRYLSLRYRQAQLLFALGESAPELAPCGKLKIG